MEGKTKVYVKPKKAGLLTNGRKGFEGYIDGYTDANGRGRSVIVIANKKFHILDMDDLEIID